MFWLFIIFMQHLSIFICSFVNLIKIIKFYAHLFIEFLHLFLTSGWATIFLTYFIVLQEVSRRKIVQDFFLISFQIDRAIFCHQWLAKFS
jgi:hypothetical protein